MTAYTELPPEFTQTSDLRPAARLSVTLLVATAVHLAVLLGVSFSFTKPEQIAESLEITLATFKSSTRPKDADFLAQSNQEGSGTLDKKAAPKTTELAPFQDSKINKVTPPPTPPKSEKQQAPKAAVTTRSAQNQKAPTANQTEKNESTEESSKNPEDQPISSEIASLEAQISNEQQAYAKRPKIQRLNAASTMQDKGAWYKEDWRKKIERIGNLNYPPEAVAKHLYGDLRMLVSINRDGSLYEIQVLESSGEPLLDEAAKRIIRLAAPFTPFSGDLADIDRLEIIRTWRFAKGNKLSSN